MNKISLINLDCKITSTLDWKEAKTLALQAISKGNKLLWHLDLGLFKELNHPLSHKGQFLTLSHALDHFKEKIWPEFRKFSKGALLYQGSPLFDLQIDEENFQEWVKERKLTQITDFEKALYKRDVAGDYLSSLYSTFSESIPTYIMFEGLSKESLPLQIALCHPDVFQGIQIINGFDYKIKNELTACLCLPPPEAAERFLYEKIEKATLKLSESNIFPKYLPESQLNQLWSGLFTIYYNPELISSSGLRKLNGFEAAGGEAIPFSKLIGPL